MSAWKNASPDAQEFAYDFSAQGLRLKKGAFKKGINMVTIEANGYMTKTINFAKTEDIYSFLSQEDTDPLGESLRFLFTIISLISLFVSHSSSISLERQGKLKNMSSKHHQNSFRRAFCTSRIVFLKQRRRCPYIFKRNIETYKKPCYTVH